MKIGIVGSGDVGQSLASGFVKSGHATRIGSRDARNPKLTAWQNRTGSPGSIGTFSDAAEFGEVVVLATLGVATEQAIQLANPKNFSGKVVIDVTNPLVFHENAPPTLAVGFTDSQGERVQRWLPDAKVVKAFNTVGNAHFFKPRFPNGPPDMFICGDDSSAKETVAGLLGELGWPSIDVGGIEASRELEPMCILWVLSALRLGTWNLAFKLLRK